MGEGGPKTENEDIELLSADPEADDAEARERGGQDIESGADKIKAEIEEILAKGELTEEEAGRLERLRADHAEWLKHAKGIREGK